MQILTAAHNALDRVASLRPLVRIRKQRFDTEFETLSRHSFRGVFDTFQAAADSAPPVRPLGYDHPEAANMYEDRRSKIHTTDYPPLFWFASLFARQRASRVFDLGGHVGVSYYPYRKVLQYPDSLRWIVFDVPAVVRRGREIAAAEDSFGQLSFTESFSDASGCDVLFACGSLQYLPWTLGSELAKLPDPPRHVVINMLPVHPTCEYFTLQAIGTAFCPYRILSEPKLIAEMRDAGYTQVDRWVHPEKACKIPFAPEFSLDHYAGFYFSKDSSPVDSSARSNIAD